MKAFTILKLTSGFLNRKRTLYGISCVFFTLALWKLLSIMSQHRLLSEGYSAIDRFKFLSFRINNQQRRSVTEVPRHFRKPRHIPNLERDFCLKRSGNEILRLEDQNFGTDFRSTILGMLLTFRSNIIFKTNWKFSSSVA